MSAASPDAPAPARGTRRRLVPPLLRDTAFRRYWSASTVSMAGDQVTGVAVPSPLLRFRLPGRE